MYYANDAMFDKSSDTNRIGEQIGFSVISFAVN